MSSGHPDFTLSVATAIIFGQSQPIVNHFFNISLLILLLILNCGFNYLSIAGVVARERTYM